MPTDTGIDAHAHAETFARAPHSLTTNRRTAPLGIDDARPAFAWKVSGTVEQTAHEIEVFELSRGKADARVWWSGRVQSAAPFGIAYAGHALQSKTAYAWHVRVELADGTTTSWSDLAPFEMAVLDPAEWSAQWISTAPVGESDRRTLYFRSVADLPAPVVRGRAYASALGWYRLSINGTDVTGHSLVPRWTPFHSYVEYQTYDVTEAFTQGANTIGMVVADGRYRGRLGVSSKGARYGDRLAAFAQIELDLADGSLVKLVTDHTWRVGTGRIITSDPKFGERVDLRISDAAWLERGGAALGEAPVEILPPHPRALIAEETDRVTEIIRLPGTVSRAPSGAQIVDFGQNFAGVARVRLAGLAGSTVKLSYSEVLGQDGELQVGYLGGGRDRGEWFQRDEAILSDNPVWYTPWFTIHGFRYLSVEGLDRPLTGDDVEGIALSTALAETAEFTSSDSRLEQLWHNVMWALRSNFVDTPTDCPTRERSGWTGDIQVFGPTAAQLVDADTYLRRYLRNVAGEQGPDGTVPPVIPAEDSPGRGRRNLLRFASTSVGWGDVTVMLPWTLYQYYGDKDVLATQYASARAWVDQLEQRAATKRGLARRFGTRVGTLERYIVDSSFHFGEWLRPGEGAGTIVQGFTTRQPAVATAYFAHSARLLARIAEVLGKSADAKHYSEVSTRATEAWRAAFVRKGGAHIGIDKQDEYVRAIAFDLLQPDEKAAAHRRLVELIEQADFHLGTGFLSTPMLLSVLVDGGRADVAFRVLLQTTSPSWLGQIAKGATTPWETWEGYHPDGRAKFSHNHYAFGAVVQFLHERVAGLAPIEPGYRRFRVEPVIGGGLTSSSVSIETPYGRAASAWTTEDGELKLQVTVPTGTTAEVHFGGTEHVVGAGEHSFLLSAATV